MAVPGREGRGPFRLLAKGTARGRACKAVGACQLLRLELAHDHIREVFEKRDVLWLETSRTGVDRAQRTENVAVRRAQMRARIGADVRQSNHERVVFEAGIRRGVLDDEGLGHADCKVAKGQTLAGLVAWGSLP